MRGIALTLLTLAVVWGPATTVHARRRPTAEAAHLGRPTGPGVVIAHERIHVECKAGFVCRYVATWYLRVDAPTTVGFEVQSGTATVVRVQGHRVEPDIRNDDEDGSRSWGDPAKMFAGYRVRIEQSGEVTLDATGSLSPDTDSGQGIGHPVLWTRHPLIGGYYERTTLAFGAPGTAPETQELVVDYGGRWRPSRRAHWEISSRGYRHKRARARKVRDVTQLKLTWGGAVPGGPLVGFGVGFTPTKPRFRMRAGYEIGSARFLVHSAVVETDFRRRVLVVPATEAATGSLGLIPSFGAGIGAPIQVYPQTRVGVRALATLSWPVFSFVGTFDAFPPMGGLPREYHGAVYAQFSL